MIRSSSQLRPTELARHAATAVVIPALNEERAIGRVLAAIPAWVREVIVVDNGSSDRTAEVAGAAGARVIAEPRHGYGAACLAGVAAVGDADVVVFLDADFSDHPDEMERLVAPIVNNRADLVIGSRTKGRCEAGALTLVQRLGNAVACRLIQSIWGVRFTDLGPFRAIRRSSLERLHMDDRGYGWTVQMQVRAARFGLRVAEVPVSYRRRIGRSKISGTVRGVVRAGSKILFTIWHESFRRSQELANESLIVFARDPRPGKAKTRLIPAIGPEGAATLQHRMTLGVLREARRLRELRRARIVVQFAGDGADAMRALYGPDLVYRRQCEGDLGVRLSESFARAFSRGARAAVAVGTDCPTLTRDLMCDAFEALKGQDVVLGPATDGGYYLIGLRRPHAGLFQNIAWGTERVLEQTRRAARDLGLSVRLLRPLGDVDRPEDLSELSVHAAPCRRAPIISVIIPTLNEQDHIGRAIRSAVAAEHGEVEVIVVDGGSDDATVRIARECGARVLRAPRGRARQMNVGVKASRGDVLLFLHADSRLPPDFATHVRLTLTAPATVAGAFALQLEPPSPVMRFYAATTNLRSRFMSLPYGDQAVFLTRAAFDRIRGYPDLPIMEDLELVRRLRRLGRVRIVNRAVTTSARRWQRHGVFKTSLLNQFLILAHLAGVPAETLYRWRELGIIQPAPFTAMADAGNDREMLTEDCTGQLHEVGQ